MPLLVLSLAQSGVNQESFVAEEFDAHGIGGMTYLFEAPERFRSVGFWWNGDLEGAEVSLFGNNGEIGPWWPLELAGDLNLEVEGLAGDAQVSALVHGRFAQQKGLLALCHFRDVKAAIEVGVYQAIMQCIKTHALG